MKVRVKVDYQLVVSILAAVFKNVRANSQQLKASFARMGETFEFRAGKAFAVAEIVLLR
jgi:hypothetical protein